MDKKQLWAFYTPSHTVDYILEQVNWVLPFSKDSKILEPSWWDWIFISHLLNLYSIDSENIDVRDINYEVKDKILEYWVNFHCKDSLLDNNFNEWLFYQWEWYYSHIIWNPPYLNKQSDYIKTNKNKLKKLYSNIWVHDTYAMFIYMWCKLLKQWWCLWFIVSDTFLTLWIHKNFRKFLLDNFLIKEITLCPKNLFEWASVNTCIIIIQNKKPNLDSKFIINDCRNCGIWIYDWIKSEILQQDTLLNPDYVFDINNNDKFLRYATNQDKMIDYLLWWLWMHTKDNQKYLAVVNYNWIEFAKKKNLLLKVNINDVNWKDWILYHKQWWNYKYYLPAEYAVKWDSDSFSNYVIPKNTLELKDKRWFLISWVCSSLSVRLFTSWAMRESNKAMCFFPKDENIYPCEYFLWLLNSSIYNKIIKSLNHTNSIQIRDIYKLPMIHLNNEDKTNLINNVKQILEHMKINLSYDFSREQQAINIIVEKYF